jgi:hypothetical protein
MTIVFNTASTGVSSHLISTLSGYDGQRELQTFARHLNFRKRKLKNQGTPEEHYILPSSLFLTAAALGAQEVSAGQFAEIVTAKRHRVQSVITMAHASSYRPVVISPEASDVEVDVRSTARSWRRDRRAHDGLAHV